MGKESVGGGRTNPTSVMVGWGRKKVKEERGGKGGGERRRGRGEYNREGRRGEEEEDWTRKGKNKKIREKGRGRTNPTSIMVGWGRKKGKRVKRREGGGERGRG